jgi:hypothetical protein
MKYSILWGRLPSLLTESGPKTKAVSLSYKSSPSALSPNSYTTTLYDTIESVHRKFTRLTAASHVRHWPEPPSAELRHSADRNLLEFLGDELRKQGVAR